MSHPIISSTDTRYQRCILSVMDNIADPDIRFDESGVCHYFQQYREKEASSVPRGDQAARMLVKFVETIRTSGRGRKYDCIMGLSGGVDSSYLAYLAHNYGLRPLAVHFDNGWNSELAVMNIEHIIRRLGFDLNTYVIDWREFRSLQLAYLRASVVDIEAITDHAIIAVLYRLAKQFNIPYILSGTNVQTESTMPPSWIFPKTDPVNIKAIYRAHGDGMLKTYPFIRPRMQRIYQSIKKVQSVSLLNMVDYDKYAVKETLQREFGWRDYGGKHYESVWTRFFQGYILPTKFHIDKRKPHLSDLIFAGQMTRDEALAELSKPIYDERLLSEDKAFVLKKLALSEEQFNHLMSLPPRSHYMFDCEKPLDERYPILYPLKKAYRCFFPTSSGHDILK